MAPVHPRVESALGRAVETAVYAALAPLVLAIRILDDLTLERPGRD